ncbi:hypothetical protein GCM10011583_07670 [Streptomyces camponoticapitis]|uniref:Uncharacterized protein n=1 Tax=Streptomyces camponoticapitis TaxID=1616125 RepID=A0ABQ2DZA1_9ACTN|nr:hypothetical protein [Streptomyces camponoticapitis]GGJ78554.1 hypothetical protein GCM10011583_07670 [Streptomyces camponoticapitis]
MATGRDSDEEGTGAGSGSEAGRDADAPGTVAGEPSDAVPPSIPAQPLTPPPPPPASPPPTPPAQPPVTPPQPTQPPAFEYPPPSVPPQPVGPPPASGHVAAVALLNLTGLGLGYALIRDWLRLGLSLAATGLFLLLVLPADTNGAPGPLVVLYALVLIAAALDGARRARVPVARPPLVLPALRPAVAVAVALVLLAIPVGGAVAYDGAREEAVERMLLDRLAEADKKVEATRESTGNSRDKSVGFTAALGVYRDLGENEGDSRAGKLVPERLTTFYKAVSVPYTRKDYCDAVDALTYLREVPDSVDADLLGELVKWPDQPLATSLLECGKLGLAPGKPVSDGGELAELISLFPESEQAGEVKPAVAATIRDRSGKLDGAEPCSVRTELETISKMVGTFETDTAALKKSAAAGVESGTYACGVDQFKDKDFDLAQETLTSFRSTYKDSSRRDRARDIAIAAEIAQERAAAGDRLPPSSAPGGPRLEVVISNDASDAVEILYTGPVTGTVKIKACGGCVNYSSYDAVDRACKDSGKNYPRKTLRLPVGDYHFLLKHSGDAANDVTSTTDGMSIDPGYSYTYCSYVVESDPLGSVPPLIPDLPDLPDIPLPSLEPLEPLLSR